MPENRHIVRHPVKAPRTIAWSDSNTVAWINSAGSGLDPLSGVLTIFSRSPKCDHRRLHLAINHASGSTSPKSHSQELLRKPPGGGHGDRYRPRAYSSI